MNGRSYSDVVWSYPDPIPEMAQIAGMMSFYAERDEVSQTIS